MSQQSDNWELVKHYISPIKKYLTMEGVTEICVNKYDEIFVEIKGEMKRVDARFDSEHSVETLIIQIANALGQVADNQEHSILDARLWDGSRVCAVLSPTATKGANLTIRTFPKLSLSSDDLLKSGSITDEMLEFLRLSILTKANMLVSGGTGSGKTTLLNILSNLIPKEERVITVEDTQELQCNVDNLISLEAPRRRAGKGEIEVIDMGRLIKTTLRQRPDRIMVGEIRDPEAAAAFLTAINTGHSGVCSTIHANNCTKAIVRLAREASSRENAAPWDVIEYGVREDVNVLIHAERTPKHGRRVVEISEIQDTKPVTIWSFNHTKGEHEFFRSHLKDSQIIKNTKKYGIPLSNFFS